MRHSLSLLHGSKMLRQLAKPVLRVLGDCEIDRCFVQLAPAQGSQKIGVRKMTSAFLFLPALENLTSGSHQKDLSNLLANNQVHNKMYISQKKKKKKGYSPLAPDRPLQVSLSPGQCTAKSGGLHRGLPYRRPGTRCISPKGIGSPPATPV